MICAAVSDGIAARINQAVTNDIHVNTGRRNHLISGARSVTTVTNRLTPVAIVQALVTSKPTAQ